MIISFTKTGLIRVIYSKSSQQSLIIKWQKKDTVFVTLVDKFITSNFQKQLNINTL